MLQAVLQTPPKPAEREHCGCQEEPGTCSTGVCTSSDHKDGSTCRLRTEIGIFKLDRSLKNIKSIPTVVLLKKPKQEKVQPFT